MQRLTTHMYIDLMHVQTTNPSRAVDLAEDTERKGCNKSFHCLTLPWLRCPSYHYASRCPWLFFSFFLWKANHHLQFAFWFIWYTPGTKNMDIYLFLITGLLKVNWLKMSQLMRWKQLFARGLTKQNVML